MPSSVFRCFKCISVYFGVYTDPYRSCRCRWCADMSALYYIILLQRGKNKHVAEGHLTIFCNNFTNFSQSISNNHYFSLWYTGPTISYL